MFSMSRIDRRTVLRLAAEADIDPRSAAKALRSGADSLRGRTGERAAEAMQRLGMPNVNAPSEPPHAA